MRKYIPFKATFKVVPERHNGKRFEYIRELERMVAKIKDELLVLSGLTDYQRASGEIGSITVLSKPQIGQNPSQIIINGFYIPTNPSENFPTYPNKSLVHTGQSLEGEAGGHGWDSNPNTTIDDYCSIIKDYISVIGVVVNVEMYKLEVAGVNYGDKGYHFPR